jgi:hypothetical protein
VRPVHQKSTCLTQLKSGPHVVQRESRYRIACRRVCWILSACGLLAASLQFQRLLHDPGIALNSRTTTLQKCAVVPRRARRKGSYTFVSLNLRLEIDKEEKKMQVLHSAQFGLPTASCNHVRTVQQCDGWMCCCGFCRDWFNSTTDGCVAAASAEIGILVPNIQRQHRTMHIYTDVLPYALC